MDLGYIWNGKGQRSNDKRDCRYLCSSSFRNAKHILHFRLCNRQSLGCHCLCKGTRRDSESINQRYRIWLNRMFCKQIVSHSTETTAASPDMISLTLFQGSRQLNCLVCSLERIDQFLL